MNKIDAYSSLVEKRKSCQECGDLCNPATVISGKYDSEQIGPWSLWQADLNAELLIVGQDWGDISYFQKWQGRDQPSGNPTNENLQKLLNHLGVQIGRPRDPQDQVVFFTNLILCLKAGGLQAAVNDHWFTNCARAFFGPLVEIIKPRAILALGKKVSESILDLYGIQHSKNLRLSEMMSQSPFSLTSSAVLFPLYHCGAGGINRNRSMPEQEKDWSRIKEWLWQNASR